MPQAVEVVGKDELGPLHRNLPIIVSFEDDSGRTVYYKKHGEGSTPNRNEAWVYKCIECYGRRALDPANAQYEIMPDGTPLGYLEDPGPYQPAQPAVPIPLIERKLVPTAVDMLKLAPKNPVARAYVQAAVRLPVPEELETYEAVAEWFEKNYTPPATPTSPAPAARRPAPQLAIEIPYTEDVSGQCTYTAQVHGTIIDAVDVDDLIQLIEDNNCEDMDDLVSAVVGSANSEGEQNVGAEGNYNYENYENTGSFGVEPEPDRRELAERLHDFLAEHSPETLESLGG